MRKKIKNEKDTRDGILNYARKIGAERDLQELFNKWDRMMAMASDSERGDMGKLAILEVQQLLDIYAQAGLTINDVIIMPNKLNE